MKALSERIRTLELTVTNWMPLLRSSPRRHLLKQI